MAVMQGRSIAAVLTLLQEYDKIPYIHSIGIPRHFITTIAPDARLKIAKEIQRRYPNRYGIHLLGLNPEYINEPALHVSYGVHVRSVDTSAPFNYARYGLVISPKHKIPRAPDWNTYQWDAGEKLLVEHNIKLLRAWCKGGALPLAEASTG